MRQTWRFSAVIVGLLVALSSVVGAAESASDRAAEALKTLNAWVGDDANGQAWQRYLRSDDLAQQIALGEAADRGTLAAIHKIYAGETPGLERWRFVEVREALAAWVDSVPAMQRDQLGAAAIKAKANFTPVSAAQAAEAKSQLEVDIERLAEFLSRASDDDEAAWKRYLMWDPMQEQLAAEKPDFATLQRVAAKYYRNENGLDLTQFSSVRDSLRNYMNVSALANSSNLKELYERQLDTLAPLLDAYAATPDAETAVKIGQVLGWLDVAGQAEPLVSAVRQHYCRPNLTAQVSERLISAGVEEEIAETIAISDNIMGTEIYGTATTYGNLTVDLLPNAKQAELSVQLAGTTYSNNVGYNRGVKIYTTGVTSVWGAKPIFVDEQGISAAAAYARCGTNSSINNIVANAKIIERIAWRKAFQSQASAEYAASRNAEWRVAQRMDSQAQEMLVDARGRFDDEFRKPLMRRGEYPQAMRFRTTDRNLHVVMEQINAAQLGAPSDPPKLSDTHDLSVRVHESMVRNFSRAMIGGVTLTDEKVVEMLSENGEVPDELKITPDSQPWSITFSGNDPVSATFADDQLTFAVRVRRFTSGEQEVRRTIEMSAAYKLEKTAKGAKLTRVGDLNVEYVGTTGTLSSTQIALRTVLRKKFEALFKPEFATDGLQLPGKFKSIGPLHLRQLQSKSGWLALGWLLPGQDRTASLPDGTTQ